jgi:hypothetical protein
LTDSRVASPQKVENIDEKWDETGYKHELATLLLT